MRGALSASPMDRWCSLRHVPEPSRRLEDCIRELCAKAVDADAEDFQPAIEELKVALREHTDRLRELAAKKLAPTTR